MDILQSVQSSKFIFIEYDTQDNFQFVKELLSHSGKVHKIGSINEMTKGDFSEIDEISNEEEKLLVFPLEELRGDYSDKSYNVWDNLHDLPALKEKVRKLVLTLKNNDEPSHKIVFTYHNTAPSSFYRVLSTLPIYTSDLALKFNKESVWTEKDRSSFVKENPMSRDAIFRMLKIKSLLESVD